jgi:hypothetical protein
METERPIIRYCKQIQTDILTHSKSFSEDQLRYIRAILLSQEMAGKVPVLQLLSACLKSSRALSHPERLLGKKRPAESHTSFGIGDETTPDDNVSNELIIVSEFAGCFDSLWTLLVGTTTSSSSSSSATYKPAANHVVYFFLCLCGDVLKVLSKSRAPDDNRNVALRHSIVLKMCNFVSSHSAVLSQSTDIYWQSFTKAVQILLYELTHFENSEQQQQRNELVVFQIGTAIASANLFLDARPVLDTIVTNHYDPNRCNLISMDVDSHVFSILFASHVTVLNTLLKMISFQSHAVSSATIELMGNLFLALERTFQDMKWSMLMRLWSSDDKNMIFCLLQSAEIQLRLEHVVAAQMLTQICPQFFDRSLATVSSYYSIEQGFVYFVAIALRYDVSLLLDLLCGTETQTLQYLLRALKHTASRTDVFIEAIANADLSSRYLCSETVATASVDAKGTANHVDDAASTSRRCIVLSEMMTSAVDEPIVHCSLDAVSLVEWNRDYRHTAHRHHAENESAEEILPVMLLNRIRSCMDQLNNKLQQRTQMMPFDPKLLRQKLSIIVNELDTILESDSDIES